MVECQKFNFWQNGEIFGKIFGGIWEREYEGKGEGRGGGISVAKSDFESARNRLWAAKNFVFGRMGKFLAGFLAIWGSFWQITFVRVAKKPINRAFVGDSGKCQKFSFWQLGRCFWHFGQNFWQITDVRLLESL